MGQAVARELAGHGHTVILWYHRSDPNQVAAFVQSLGPQHEAHALDITNREQVEKTLATIRSKYATIDVCVHAAVRPLLRKKILALTEAEFKQEFDVGVFGGFTVLQLIGQVMAEQKSGRIIGITSSAIEPNTAGASMGGYTSAKYALRGLLRELARELAPFEVTVNAVAPGFMRTDLQADMPERLDDFLREKNPMHRLVTPTEVAGVVGFLCSPEARYLTGGTYLVSAGEVMNL